MSDETRIDLRDVLADAMQNAWCDFVVDSGNYPDVLERRGTELVADFGRGNFAEMVVGWFKRLIGDGHFVVFTEDRFTIEHSLDCRLSGLMHECSYHAAIVKVADEGFDPDLLGRWKIVEVDSEGLPSLTRSENPVARDQGGDPSEPVSRNAEIGRYGQVSPAGDSS